MPMSYPFFGNPLASLAMPLAVSEAVQSVQAPSSSSSVQPNNGNDKKRSTSSKRDAIQDLLWVTSLLDGFGFGSAGLPAGSQPDRMNKSTGSKPAAESGSSKTEANNPAASNDNQQKQTSNKSSPTPENGQAARASEHQGNGKSTHDEASEESGMQIFHFLL